MSSSNKKNNDHEVNTPVPPEEGPKIVNFIQPFAGGDELGRILPRHEEVGDIKENRTVGIFYFLWQGDNAQRHQN